jgi:chemotaxis protein methyltransferase CheR
MNYGEFSFLADFLRAEAGLVVTQDKTYLIENRLATLARGHGLSGIGEVVARLRANPVSALARDVVYAMTASETSFFRDVALFETLDQMVLPAIMARRIDRRVLRIWNAACATGQEPYSLAMLLKEKFPIDGWSVSIVATDVSPAALERAAEGCYSDFEVQRGLADGLLLKYFEPEGDLWRIKAELREMIEFCRVDPFGDFSDLGIFDIILCRNALLYFDRPGRAAILDMASHHLAADGVLMPGGEEPAADLSGRYTGMLGLNGVYCHRIGADRRPPPAAVSADNGEPTGKAS